MIALENTAEKSVRKQFFWRLLFVYMVLNIIPLDGLFYEYLWGINWTDINCRDLFIIGTYRHLQLIGNWDVESFKWGILGYVNLVIPFLLAALIALLWGYLQKNISYTKLRYWLEVAIRYRVGIGMIAWGFRKLLPSQMVLPTQTILNTWFGDIQAQKHYWQSVGIVPGYEVFLGFAELIPGLLLLFKRTSILGGTLAFVVMVNVTLANHAFDGSVHIHSFTYAIWSFILIYPYLGAIYQALVLNLPTQINPHELSFGRYFQRFRIVLKSAVIFIFVFIFFGLQIKDYLETPYRLPKTPGVTALNGFYHVERFVWNGEELPYDPTDSIRWQEAIFEDWRTLSFKVNKASPIDRSNGGGYTQDDRQRKWEVAGIAGGRQWFHYQADQKNKKLFLFNKNDFFCMDQNSHHFKQQYGKSAGDPVNQLICSQTMVLSYNVVQDTVTLVGADNLGDSIYIKLIKKQRQYPLLAKR